MSCKVSRETEEVRRTAKNKHSKPSGPGGVHTGAAQRDHPLLALQHTMGNRALGQILPRRDEAIGCSDAPTLGEGRPLRQTTLDVMERSFDRDFSDVRVHDGPGATERARTVGARAFTFGTDIVFGEDEFVPHTPTGRRLLAHELAHIVQQSPETTGPSGTVTALEAEARAAGKAVAAGEDVVEVMTPAPQGLLQHQPIAGGRSTGVGSVAEAEGAGAELTSTMSIREEGPIEETALASVNEAMNRAMRAVDEANAARESVEQLLLPAFQNAVDAADPVGALELATALVSAARIYRENLAKAQQLAERYDPTRFVTSTPDEAGPVSSAGASSNTPLGPPFEPAPDPVPEALARYPALATSEPAVEDTIAGPSVIDFGLHTDLLTELDAALDAVDRFELEVLVGVTPTEFRGDLVVGSRPIPRHDDALEAITREAATTVDLLWTVEAVRGLVEAGDGESLRRAVDLVEPWKSRPLNLLFVLQVLRAEGLTERLSTVESSSGRTLGDLHSVGQETGRTFGVTADVGAYEQGRAEELLSRSLGDWAITDEDAMSVFEMWTTATRPARLAILERLDKRGLLIPLCENLPGLAVRAMFEDIQQRGLNAPAVQYKLMDYLSEQAGGQTATEVYEAAIMENIEEGDYVSGYLWTLLNVSHSALTFGFKDIHDQAYVARREGRITSDEYWSTTTKAAGRTAALLAVSTLSGGAAGGFAEGVALGRGATASTASLISGGAGGAVSGIATQFSADVYDQALLGREGFSNLGDYGLAAGLGAGSGLATPALGRAGSRYLPRSAQQRLAQSAERTFEYHAGSPAGNYRFAGRFRQGVHARLYGLYRGSVHAGRRIGRGTLPPEDLARWADLSIPDQRTHTLHGEGDSSGGHMWPPNRTGGPNRGPKSSFPRELGEDEIMHVLSDIMSDPRQTWTQQTGPGTGTQITGYPNNPPTTNAGNPVTYTGTAVRGGIEIKVVIEPGGRGLVTGYPIGSQDPALLVPYVRPGVTEAYHEDE